MCVYVCLYVYVSLCACLCLYMHVCLCVCLWMCIYVPVCHVCVCVHVHLYFTEEEIIVQRIRAAFPGHMDIVMELGPDTRAHQANK